jgi:hypothetical protein
VLSAMDLKQRYVTHVGAVSPLLRLFAHDDNTEAVEEYWIRGRMSFSEDLPRSWLIRMLRAEFLALQNPNAAWKRLFDLTHLANSDEEIWNERILRSDSFEHRREIFEDMEATDGFLRSTAEVFNSQGYSSHRASKTFQNAQRKLKEDMIQIVLESSDIDRREDREIFRFMTKANCRANHFFKCYRTLEHPSDLFCQLVVWNSIRVQLCSEWRQKTDDKGQSRRTTQGIFVVKQHTNHWGRPVEAMATFEPGDRICKVRNGDSWRDVSTLQQVADAIIDNGPKVSFEFARVHEGEEAMYVLGIDCIDGRVRRFHDMWLNASAARRSSCAPAPAECGIRFFRRGKEVQGGFLMEDVEEADDDDEEEEEKEEEQEEEEEEEEEEVHPPPPVPFPPPSAPAKCGIGVVLEYFDAGLMPDSVHRILVPHNAGVFITAVADGSGAGDKKKQLGLDKKGPPFSRLFKVSGEEIHDLDRAQKLLAGPPGSSVTVVVEYFYRDEQELRKSDPFKIVRRVKP